MPLVKTGEIVADRFVRLADDAAPDAGADILVTADRFLAEADALLARNASTGVIWPNNRDLDALVPYLDRLACVALVFPGFRDGRAYSQARLLRERYGFKGELRATGQVLRDQFMFMVRTGFDAFEAVKDADAKAFNETVQRYTVFYQPTGESKLTALRQRMQARHAAESASS